MITHNEITLGREGMNRLIAYSPILNKVYPSLFKTDDFRAWPTQVKIDKPSKPSANKLKALYEVLCLDLNKRYSSEAQTNTAEIKMASILRKHIQLRFHRNVWIGGRNIDFLFENVGHVQGNSNKSIKGFAVEIDGGIHDSQPKMAKDQYLYRMLHNIGIGMICMSNEDAMSEGYLLKYLIPVLRNKNLRLSTRDVERVRLRKHLCSILASSTNEDISRLFEISPSALIDAVKIAESFANR